MGEQKEKKMSLSEIYNHIQKFMSASLGVSSVMEPSVTKGTATEYNWIEFFRTYLPKRYRVDKGVVIDSKGKRSDEIDIIIYDAQYSHFVLRSVGSVFIPAESVYAVFEVKQNLNKDHMEYAGKKAESVRKLHRTSTKIINAGKQVDSRDLYEIIAGLLTTSSDWKSKTKDNVVECLNERINHQHLDLICSIENNTFSVSNNASCKKNECKVNYDIKYCNSNKTLIYLLLELLKKLQGLGTAPAIDFAAYEKPINAQSYKKNTH